MSKLMSVITAAVIAMVGVLLVAGSAAAGTTTVGSTPVRSWGLNGRVYASAVIGNEVVLGGAFTQATSPTGVVQTASHLAAFDVTTGAPIAGFAATADGDVRALATDGTTVWVGGAFTHVDTLATNHLTAIDPTTGAVRSGFVASANAAVTALDVHAGKVYAGGDFTTVNKLARTRLAAVDGATGVVDPAFVASADAHVYAVRVNPAGTCVYVAGSFATVGGLARTGLAAVDATTGATSAVVFSGSVSPTMALDVSPDGATVYAGQGGSGNSAVAWKSTTGAKVWSVRTDGNVQAVKYAAGDLFLGFHDGYQGVTTTKLLAANAVTGAVDTRFHPVFDGFWGTWTIAAAGGYLVDGGDFTTVAGVAAGDWSRFTLTTS